MRKYLILLIGIALMLVACDNNEQEVKDNETNNRPPTESEPVEPEEVEPVENEDEPIDERVEIDKTIELNGATIVIQSLRGKDDSTQLYGRSEERRVGK